MSMCALAVVPGCWWGDDPAPEPDPAVQEPEPQPEPEPEPEPETPEEAAEREAELQEALDEQAQEADWTFDYDPPAEINVDNPPEERGGLIMPDDPESLPSVEPESTEPLPDRFDWRDEGVVGPIRDQGECGSCWAFAACSVAESVHAIAGRPLPDISEQWLVDCNQEGWGCVGGVVALGYFVDWPDVHGRVGGVEEHHAPYQGLDGPCVTSAQTLPPLGGWALVSSPHAPADSETLKRSIKEFGPIWAHVLVDLPFLLYTGGVYNNHDPLFFGFHHAVVITGWDDSQGAEGVWLVRNSWGPFWGELGTMRIEYGANEIGHFSAVLSEYPIEDGEASSQGEGETDGVQQPQDDAQQPQDDAQQQEEGEGSGQDAEDGSSGQGGGGGGSGGAGGDGFQGGPDAGGGGAGGGGGAAGGGGGAGGGPDDLDVLDARLDILEEALQDQSEGVIPTTPEGVDVDLEDLKPDLDTLDPAAPLLVGIWEQTGGLRG
ncbi:MAG: C1 family peptidase, partial [Phycisphaerales bacterium]|nr:C1 family peptidase [Phycisphaerales bacterium]